MEISFSLLTIAAGAILAFAVHATTRGIDLTTVGWILMIVGAVGLVVSLVMWETASRRLPLPRRRRGPPDEMPTRRF